MNTVSGTYAGDVSSREAYSALLSSSGARLIDVRTKAEWAFVGVPDISSTGQDPAFIEWQSWPGGVQNPDFVSECLAFLGEKSVDVYLLCRSGARSASAAAALSAAGVEKCYNIVNGFEGAHDSERHRGRLSGWKAEGLPWAQS